MCFWSRVQDGVCYNGRCWTGGTRSQNIRTAKERLKSVIEAQPDDASYDEILRELAFERMVERGLSDSREGRTIGNE